MKKIFYVIILLSSLSKTYAQQDIQIQGQQIYMQNITQEKQTLGSKYLDENFILGKLNDETKVPIRFNVFENQFEAKNSIGNIIILDKVYSKINLNNEKVYNLIDYLDKNKNIQSNKYVRAIDRHNNNLYLLEKISYIPKKEALNGYDTEKPARYTIINPAYIIKYNDKYYEITNKTKDLEKLFPEKAPEIKSFIKSNKIKLDKEDDLLKLTDFLNK